MRVQFGKTIVDMAEADKKLYLLYGDVYQNMQAFEEKFPNRLVNMGIAEQAMTSMAAGLASEGLHPVLYSLTPFITERNAEQWKLDVDRQHLPVIAVGYSDYAGHGPTQAPANTRMLVEALCRNTRYYEPKSGEETRQALLSAHEWAIREHTPSIIVLTKER